MKEHYEGEFFFLAMMSGGQDIRLSGVVEEIVSYKVPYSMGIRPETSQR